MTTFAITETAPGLPGMTCGSPSKLCANRPASRKIFAPLSTPLAE